MDAAWILQELILPIILPLGLLLAAPYVAVKGLCLYGPIRATGIETSLLLRATYTGILLCILFVKAILSTNPKPNPNPHLIPPLPPDALLVKAVFAARSCATHLHNQVRDRKYLMGRKLHNLELRDSPPPRPNRGPTLPDLGDALDVT